MTTTNGTISVQFATLRANANLETMVEAMRAGAYDGSASGKGWGNVMDGREHLLNKVSQERIKGGAAELLAQDDRPRQIRARYYWNAVDKTVLGYTGGDTNQALRFRATDVLIMETDKPSVFRCALGSRQDADLGSGLNLGLRALATKLDKSGALLLDTDADPLGLGDRDFYVWLMYRSNFDGGLSDDVTLVDVRAMECDDATFRNLAVKGGTGMDRGELLAPIIDRSRRWGPAKIELFRHSDKLRASLELWPDGTFAIFRGGSGITAPEKLDKDAEGLELLQQVLHFLLPELMYLYRSDDEWRNKNRDLFFETARLNLRALTDP